MAPVFLNETLKRLGNTQEISLEVPYYLVEGNMIQQVLVTPESIELLKKLLLAPNEGVMAVKFVLLTQQTLTAGDAVAKIENAPSAILLGDLDEMKATLSSWMEEAIKAYKGK